jgi:hypothetical protein
MMRMTDNGWGYQATTAVFDQWHRWEVAAQEQYHGDDCTRNLQGVSLKNMAAPNILAA